MQSDWETSGAVGSACRVIRMSAGRWPVPQRKASYPRASSKKFRRDMRERLTPIRTSGATDAELVLSMGMRHYGNEAGGTCQLLTPPPALTAMDAAG